MIQRGLLVGEVALVSDEDRDQVAACGGADLLDEGLQHLEGVLAGNVEGQDGPNSTKIRLKYTLGNRSG